MYRGARLRAGGSVQGSLATVARQATREGCTVQCCCVSLQDIRSCLPGDERGATKCPSRHAQDDLPIRREENRGKPECKRCAISKSDSAHVLSCAHPNIDPSTPQLLGLRH